MVSAWRGLVSLRAGALLHACSSERRRCCCMKWPCKDCMIVFVTEGHLREEFGKRKLVFGVEDLYGS